MWRNEQSVKGQLPVFMLRFHIAQTCHEAIGSKCCQQDQIQLTHPPAHEILQNWEKQYKKYKKTEDLGDFQVSVNKDQYHDCPLGGLVWLEKRKGKGSAHYSQEVHLCGHKSQLNQDILNNRYCECYRFITAGLVNKTMCYM